MFSSIIKYIKSVISGNPDSILIWFNSGMGNTVQAIPAMLEIKRLRPELKVVVAGLKNNIELINSSKIADEFYVVPSGRGLLRHMLFHEPGLIRKYRYIFVFLSNSPARLIFLKRTGLVTNIVSVICKNNQQYTQDITVEYTPERNESETNLSVLAAAGISGVKIRPAQLFLTEEELSNAKKWLLDRNLHPKNFALIHPGWIRENSIKGLPVKLVHDLPASLLERYDKVALILGPSERNVAEKFNIKKNSDLEIIAEDFPMRMLAAIIANAAILISGDTGLAHIASASGTPIITCYGPTSDKRNAVSGTGKQMIITSNPILECLRCEELNLKKACKRKCLEDITVTNIIDKLDTSGVIFDIKQH